MKKACEPSIKISPREEDEFKVVSYKKRKKHHKKNFVSSTIMRSASGPHLVCGNSIRIIQEELNCSEFIMRFKEDFLPIVNEWCLENKTSNDSNGASLNCVDNFTPTSDMKQGIDIICYGLGQFSSCVIARYQLAFLLILKQILHSTQVDIYDPVFSVNEVDFLKTLGLNVLDINEEAKRTLKTRAICFLPHCDMSLYNNLLWANWNIKCLSRLLIIGNSFQNYEFTDAKGFLKVLAKHIYLANRFSTEIKISNNFHFRDIFNDLAIHYFKTSSLSLVDSLIWTELEEPEYIYATG